MIQAFQADPWLFMSFFSLGAGITFILVGRMLRRK